MGSNGQAPYSQCRRPPKGTDGRKVSFWIGFVHWILLKEVRFQAEIHAMTSYCIIVPFESKLEEKFTVPKPVVRMHLRWHDAKLSRSRCSRLSQRASLALARQVPWWGGFFYISCFFKGWLLKWLSWGRWFKEFTAWWWSGDRYLDTTWKEPANWEPGLCHLMRYAIWHFIKIWGTQTPKLTLDVSGQFQSGSLMLGPLWRQWS